MKQTEIISIYDSVKDRAGVLHAAELLRRGGTVIIPTETVYGLAANAGDAGAVAQVFEAKGRPADNPLIVHIARMEELPPLVTEVPENARILAARFWPGPLTMILPKSAAVPDITAGGLDTVAIRMPANPIARAIIEACGFALAAPSANRSGSPSPTTAAHCIDDMAGRVDAIVKSAPCTVGVESTVVSLCGPVPTLLRPGAVTLEELRDALGPVELGIGVLERLEENARALSPGLKYKHYSPQADVILIKGTREEYLRWLFDYEFRLLGLPAPDRVIYLQVDPAVSQRLMTQRYHGDESKKDVHEKDTAYLARSRAAAEFCARHLGWDTVHCTSGDALRSIEEIQQEVQQLARKTLG